LALHFDNLLLELFNQELLHIVLLHASLLQIRLAMGAFLNAYETELFEFKLSLFLELVDLLQKHDVLFHEAALNILSLGAGLGHDCLKVLNLLLQVVYVTELGVSGSALFVLVFVQDILLVQSDKTLLERLVVFNLEQALVDILHELLLVRLLLVDLEAEDLFLLNQTALAHA